MSQPSIAAEVHEPLDVHRPLAPQVSLHDIIAVDDLADLEHLLIGQLRHPPRVGNSDFPHDFTGLFGPDPMDVLQCNNDAFVGRYIDAGDAGHGHALLLPAQSRWPAIIAVDSGPQTITRHPPRSPGPGIVRPLDLDAGY